MGVCVCDDGAGWGVRDDLHGLHVRWYGIGGELMEDRGGLDRWSRLGNRNRLDGDNRLSRGTAHEASGRSVVFTSASVNINELHPVVQRHYLATRKGVLMESFTKISEALFKVVRKDMHLCAF